MTDTPTPNAGGNFPPSSSSSTGAPASFQVDYASSPPIIPPTSSTAAELLDRLAELEAAQLEPIQAGPGPRARVARTAVQAVFAFLAAVPTAWAALVAAGVEVEPQVAALVVGIPAALLVLVSAVWNTIDSRRGLA